jgi:hypothetical protein
MTSAERVYAAYDHKPVDRTPLFEYLLGGPCATLIAGRPFVDYAYNQEGWQRSVEEIGFHSTLQYYVENRLDIAEKLGHDLLYVCPNPLSSKKYAYDPLLQAEDYYQFPDIEDPVERLTLRNGRIRENLLNKPSQESYTVYIKLKKEMEKRNINLPMFVPAYFHGIWNDVDLMQTLLLDAEVAKEHFSLATVRAKQIIDDYISLGLDIIGIGGDFAGKVPLISPEVYSEFVVPEVKILADYVRAKGGYSVNATDGNIWMMMDDFVFGCAVDAYMEIDYSAGMRIGELKQRYGSVLTLMGNMDCGNVLTFSSEEEIRTITHSILDEGWGNGGHIFTASNAITASVPISNYLAMVNAYREHFSLDNICID